MEGGTATTEKLRSGDVNLKYAAHPKALVEADLKKIFNKIAIQHGVSNL